MSTSTKTVTAGIRTTSFITGTTANTAVKKRKKNAAAGMTTKMIGKKIAAGITLRLMLFYIAKSAFVCYNYDTIVSEIILDCRFSIFFQQKKLYISLNRNTAKHTTTEIYPVSDRLASIQRTIRTISLAA